MLGLLASFVEIRPKWDWKIVDDSTIFKVRDLVEIRPKWDWKWGCFIRLIYQYRNVEIRPKWDWKTLLLQLLQRLHLLVEIRPKWDWKLTFLRTSSLSILVVEIRPKWDWKWTLDDLDMAWREAVEIRPKWDWKILNINNWIDSISRWNQTKVGLKVAAIRGARGGVKIVEIRPKWDWKIEAYWLKITKRVLLKSDQSGIERSCVKNPHLRHLLRWNQTKVGLKDIQVGLLQHPLTMVEIRPKWDWKEVFPVHPEQHFSSLQNKLKSDQSGIERTLWKLVRWRRVLVEIRPKWDWKSTNSLSSLSHHTELKSDQSGIESEFGH